MIENHVTSLEISKKLKSLNIPQESKFYWSFYDGGNTKEYPGIISTNEANHGFKEDLISAFLSSELGEMLPQILEIKGIKYQLFVSVALDKQWFVVYANEEDYHDNAPIRIIMRHNEADARAKMLIHLIENSIIDVKSL